MPRQVIPGMGHGVWGGMGHGALKTREGLTFIRGPIAFTFGWLAVFYPQAVMIQAIVDTGRDLVDPVNIILRTDSRCSPRTGTAGSAGYMPLTYMSSLAWRGEEGWRKGRRQGEEQSAGSTLRIKWEMGNSLGNKNILSPPPKATSAP